VINVHKPLIRRALPASKNADPLDSNGFRTFQIAQRPRASQLRFNSGAAAERLTSRQVEA
jgi:hypothetical protein